MSDMRINPEEDYGPYLARLGALPFVDEVRVERLVPRRGDARRGAATWDALLDVRVAGRRHHFFAEYKRAPRLNFAVVDALLGRLQGRPGDRWILLTPYVTPQIAAHLQARGVNYVDRAGNCHLVVDKGHIAIIEGRRLPPQPVEARATGPGRYRVLFALLARPDTIRMTVRDIAGKAGVGKTVAALTLQLLEREGLIAQTQTNTFLVKPKELLDRWLTGYLEILRPRLLIGYYRAAEKNPEELEQRIERALERPGEIPRAIHRTEDWAGGKRTWAWGGTTAAFRLTGHYRGEQTVLHMDDPPADFTRRLQLLPARTGEVAILAVPGPLAYEGAVPRTVHPLLVYAELLAGRDERAREAAAEVRTRFLRYLE